MEEYKIAIKFETKRIGQCDHCSKENRYLKKGYDNFGVHIVDICEYGCMNKKSIFNSEYGQ